jgi:hypothetical protein
LRPAGILRGLLSAAAALLLPIPIHAEIHQETHGDEIVATNVASKAVPPSTSRTRSEISTRPAAQPIVPASPPEIGELLSGSAVRYGFDPAFIQAVVAAESAFDQRAVSRSGARGLMQLMPDTAHRYGVKDMHDPATNLEAGVAFLREQVSRFHGDVTLALAAYNAGPESVAKYGGVPPYEETHQYLERIRSFYGDDLQRGDRSTGATGIRLAAMEEGGVPLYTNVPPRRIPRSVRSDGSKGHR